jgi:16S rRNA processing protein RimM
MQEQFLGRVQSLIETGANQVLVTKDGEHERLLPFIAQVVKDVDVPGRRIRVEWGSDW